MNKTIKNLANKTVSRWDAVALDGGRADDEMVASSISWSDYNKPETRRRALAMKKILTSQQTKLRKQLLEYSAQLPQAKRDHLRMVLEAIDEADKGLLREYGLNIDQAWLHDMVLVMAIGQAPIEIQSILTRPHAQWDPLTQQAVINPLLVSPEDLIGIELAALFRKLQTVCEAIHIVVGVDDTAAAVSGRPLTPEESDHYLLSLASLLERKGILPAQSDVGAGYNFDRYSQSATRIDRLVARLRSSNRGAIVIDEAGNMYFKPSLEFVESLVLKRPASVKKLQSLGVLLRDAEGQATPEALLAANFIDGPRRMVHFLAVDIRWIGCHDAGYTLLRAIDQVTPERFHDIYFDSAVLTPELASYALSSLFVDSLDELIKNFDKFDAWSEFDSEEYVQRNYGGDTILPEDVSVIRTVVQSLERLGIEPHSLHKVADVGSGPNLYPSMLVAPYVSPSGHIDLLEYSPNRNYLEKVIAGKVTSEQALTWHKFEKLMVELGGERYKDCEAYAKKLLRSRFGDIFALPKAEYELISSYFVAESIVDSMMPFREAIRSLAGALQPGGILVVVHVVGSEGWHAGDDTSFPAINLNLDQIREAYLSTDLTLVSLRPFQDDEQKFREGYHGMALAIAIRH